jgi:aminopeptidase N
MQSRRIKDPDRKARFTWLQPTLSRDTTIRDDFFNSLSERKNREKKVWTTMGLTYLFHPLRTPQAYKHIPKALSLLEDVRASGDIFYPRDWLNSILGYARGSEPENMVRAYLDENHEYEPKLRGKILQAADDLFRANKLMTSKT